MENTRKEIMREILMLVANKNAVANRLGKCEFVKFNENSISVKVGMNSVCYFVVGENNISNSIEVAKSLIYSTGKDVHWIYETHEVSRGMCGFLPIEKRFENEIKDPYIGRNETELNEEAVRLLSLIEDMEYAVDKNCCYISLSRGLKQIYFKTFTFKKDFSLEKYVKEVDIQEWTQSKEAVLDRVESTLIEKDELLFVFKEKSEENEQKVISLFNRFLKEEMIASSLGLPKYLLTSKCGFSEIDVWKLKNSASKMIDMDNFGKWLENEYECMKIHKTRNCLDIGNLFLSTGLFRINRNENNDETRVSFGLASIDITLLLKKASYRVRMYDELLDDEEVFEKRKCLDFFKTDIFVDERRLEDYKFAFFYNDWKDEFVICAKHKSKREGFYQCISILDFFVKADSIINSFILDILLNLIKKENTL